MLIIHKLKLKLAKQSLARLRKGVNKRLKQSAYALVCRDMFRQGEHGYLKDKSVYRG